MVPLARSEVPLGWVTVFPIGLVATAVAVVAVGAMGRRPESPPVDFMTERALLRFGISTFVAGHLSSWLALSVYREVAFQVSGIAAGIAMCVVGTLAFGWYVAVRTERDTPRDA